tara:strand:- start:230 stop:349 length:120 start_codon:yes stop_codon:yes gene_type:complete
MLLDITKGNASGHFLDINRSFRYHARLLNIQPITMIIAT